MSHDFRFGYGLHAADSRSAVQNAAAQAEALGYDVLHVPDHLGAPAPFPTLTAAAMATQTLRLGTFVLNAGFYKPALLARDVAALQDLSGGRLELGLGAGYVEEEFAAAELPFPSARQRVDHLAHVTEYLREHVASVPILIAGNGDRLLTVAARHAQIIGLTGGEPPTPEHDPLADRIEFVRRAAGDRFADLELNVAITALPTDGSRMPNLALTRRFLPGLSDEQLLRTPGVLSGTPSEIADALRGYRDRYGVTYIIIQAPHAEAFGKVIDEMR
jgi:probable F420-dependent oxidoreductase